MNKQIAALATDEKNIVMWDIDSLLSEYKDRSYFAVDTERLIPREWLTINTEYAQSADVERPLILFELPDKLLYVADGNHRLYRAVTENVPKMNVIVLAEEEHLAYLYDSSAEVYYRVVDGLKSEGIFIDNFIGD